MVSGSTVQLMQCIDSIMESHQVNSYWNSLVLAAQKVERMLQPMECSAEVA